MTVKREDYAPYHLMHAFAMGEIAYANGRAYGPHAYRGVDEQAYDRGVECAMRQAREAERLVRGD